MEGPKKAEANEKTRWNSKVEAWNLYNALTGLVSRFDANALDSGAIKKAAKALVEIAAEVQAEYEKEAKRKAEFRQSITGISPDAVEALRRENEELKKRLMAQAR